MEETQEAAGSNEELCARGVEASGRAGGDPGRGVVPLIFSGARGLGAWPGATGLVMQSFSERKSGLEV